VLNVGKFAAGQQHNQLGRKTASLAKEELAKRTNFVQVRFDARE